MKKIQLTLVQIDNYGPWTVTPEPRHEGELQTMQAELFAELERQFTSHTGLAFQTRFDNILVITNGISLNEHRTIQKIVNKKFPVTVSMGLGAAPTPYEAQVLATLALQHAGSSRAPDRKSVLAGVDISPPNEDWVQLAHIDVDRSTMLTDSEPIYDTHLLIQRTHLSLASALMRHNALVFYMGGDNFMAPSNGLDPNELMSIFSEVKRETGFELKAGIGNAQTAEVAARLASESLHEIRKGPVMKRIVYKTNGGFALKFK